jgi:Tol biopolymer transport system component
MGEVYRARDTRLDRLVAVKILPTDRAVEEERQRRFFTEAKSASALNHPNIVTIYDVGRENGVDYLAMELVAGKPLDELIPRNGLTLKDILRYGIQIADALSKAHNAAIVHRDLKPANVMVTPDGLVKVLDFGLAKIGPSVDAGATRTVATQTAGGTVLGTTAYMSPEQAEGKPLDGRTDIFSFGVMLYEMATGQRPFRGDSQASVLASVLREDPRPPAELRPDIAPELARLITRCLRKDPERRVQSMADLRVSLQELKEDSELRKVAPSRGPSAAVGRSLRWFGVAIAALLVVAAAAGWRFIGRGPSGDTPLDPVPLTNYSGNEVQPNFSPDGNQVVFSWNGEQQDNWDIYVKLTGPGAPLRLTTDPHRDYLPAWSPDGHSIAFMRLIGENTVAVMLVPPLGGAERKIAEFATQILFSTPLASLCWAPDSRFLFVAASDKPGEPQRILRLSVDTGDVKTLAVPDDPSSNGYTRPALSPDGSTLAMVSQSGSGSIELLSLTKSFEPSGSRRLDAQGIDVGAVAWTADSRDLLVSVGVNIPAPLYRIAVAGGTPQPLLWSGPGAGSPAVSLNGRRLAFVRSARDTNIWQVALDHMGRGEPGLRKLASSSFREVFPQYSPDGRRLAFHSNRGGSVQVWTSNADGSAAVQITSMDAMATTGSARWSPDGRSLVFDSNAGGKTHVYVVPSDGGRVRAITTGSSQEYIATWSADGRWIYFTSNRSGRPQIWRVLASGGDAQQVTQESSEAPTVSPDGKWLYYTKRDGADGLWRMPIDGTEQQEERLTADLFRYDYAIARDGVYWVPAPATASIRGMDRPAASSIRFLNLTTKATTELLKIDKPVDLGLAISPDGSTLLFTQIDYIGQDLMLVENFR